MHRDREREILHVRPEPPNWPTKIIDKHLDLDVPAEERDVRRRELLHGPSGLRDVRKDHAG